MRSRADLEISSDCRERDDGLHDMALKRLQSDANEGSETEVTVTSELTRRSRKGKEKEKRGEGDTQGSGLRARQTQGGPHSPEIPTPIMMIMFMTMSARDKKARWGDGEYGRLYEVAGRAWQQRYSWPLPALSHCKVEVWGTRCMEEVILVGSGRPSVLR